MKFSWFSASADDTETQLCTHTFGTFSSSNCQRSCSHLLIALLLISNTDTEQRYLLTPFVSSKTLPGRAKKKNLQRTIIRGKNSKPAADNANSNEHLSHEDLPLIWTLVSRKLTYKPEIVTDNTKDEINFEISVFWVFFYFISVKMGTGAFHTPIMNLSGEFWYNLKWSRSSSTKINHLFVNLLPLLC